MNYPINYLTAILFYLFLMVIAACGGDTAKEAPPADTTIGPTPFAEINELSKQIAATPDNPQLYFKRARAFYEREGYDEAISDMATAMQYDSTNADFHHLLADVYLDYSKSYLALQTMQRVVGLYPERISSLLKLSEFQFILKQFAESQKTLQKVFQLDPQNAGAFFMMGMIFRDQNKIPQAIEAFQSSVEIDSDQMDAYIILGELFAAQDNPIAIQYFDNAIRVDSTNISALLTKGNYLHQSGRLEEAIAVYEKIQKKAPQSPDAYFNAGLAFMEMDSIEKAYNHFNIVVNTDPVHVMGYYFRGMAAERKGRLGQARQDYTQALNLQPEYQEAKEALERLKTPAQ